jgi:hypothetical protein
VTYIRTLQNDLKTAIAKISAKNEAVSEFRIHLHGPKFQGLDLDGGRKDWIAVSDVLAWLARISDAGV